MGQDRLVLAGLGEESQSVNQSRWLEPSAKRLIMINSKYISVFW